MESESWETREMFPVNTSSNTVYVTGPITTEPATITVTDVKRVESDLPIDDIYYYSCDCSCC